ncbi:MAG TPA: hypothetical protein VL426_07520 [Candidatus Binatia bacterium]|nr:hypothetical protein [Candidatus Binatia bacterium]
MRKNHAMRWALAAGVLTLLAVGAGCPSNPYAQNTNAAPGGNAPAYGTNAPAPQGNAYGLNGNVPQGNAYGTTGMVPQGNAYGQTQLSDKAITFAKAMTRLWEDHITWTRLYIISAAEGLKDKDLTAARLLKNQEDIGNAFKAYYGSAAGDQLTALLKEHIAGAVKLIDAAKSGDQAKITEAKDAWYKNGDDIAEFLSKANPQYWQLDAMKADMRGHLDTTLKEATDRLQKNYGADIQDYDAVKDHIYGFAATLIEGVLRQFPEKF